MRTDDGLEISLIAALDRHGAIGKGNALPWHLPADLKRFKALTYGKPILMGRKTAESLGRVLPGRPNLVITRSGRAPFDGMRPFESIDAALHSARMDGAEEVCVIGGAEIFALAMPLATLLRLTHVDTVVEGADTFFPAFDAAAWREVARETHAADAGNAFDCEFVDYRRA